MQSNTQKNIQNIQGDKISKFYEFIIDVNQLQLNQVNIDISLINSYNVALNDLIKALTDFCALSNKNDIKHSLLLKKIFNIFHNILSLSQDISLITDNISFFVEDYYAPMSTPLKAFNSFYNENINYFAEYNLDLFNKFICNICDVCDVDSNQIGFNQMDFNQIGFNQIGFNQIGINSDDTINDISINQVLNSAFNLNDIDFFLQDNSQSSANNRYAQFRNDDTLQPLPILSDIDTFEEEQCIMTEEEKYMQDIIAQSISDNNNKKAMELDLYDNDDERVVEQQHNNVDSCYNNENNNNENSDNL